VCIMVRNKCQGNNRRKGQFFVTFFLTFFHRLLFLFMYFLVHKGAGVAQSVQCVTTDWMTGV
jgi:hypothetical protein